MPHERAMRLAARGLWDWRRPSTHLGQPIFGLDPEAELLVMASYAAKRIHTFDRLLWAVDAAVVIATAPTEYTQSTGPGCQRGLNATPPTPPWLFC